MKGYKSTEDWGKKAAVERYATGTNTMDNNPAANDLQAPQDIQDKHGAKYDNDSPCNWLRGMPSAEGKPGFDKGKK